MNPNEPSRTLTRFLPLIIATAAVLIRTAPLLRSDISFAFRPGDTAEYMELADGMRHGCGFARMINGSCQVPEILRTPGYPIFLALMPGVRTALVVQAVLGGIVCLLVAAWVGRYWNWRAAILAELLVAFDIPAIVMSNEIMSEALFQLAAGAALVVPLLLEPKSRKALLVAAVAGLAAGFAILIRPIGIVIMILLPIPFLATLPGRRQRILAAVLAFIIPASMILGWSARNYAAGRYPGLSTVGAINMYWYRAANLKARQEGLLLLQTRSSFGSQLGVTFEHIYDADVQSPELTRRMNRLALAVLRAHPVEAAKMTVQSAAYLALSPIRSPLASVLGTAGGSMEEGLSSGAPSLGRIRDTLRTMLSSPLLTALVLLEVVFTLVTWLGIGAALVRCVEAPLEYRLWVLYLGCAGMLLLVLAAGGEADVRFRAPVIPLFAIVSALGYFPGTGAKKTVLEVPARRAALVA